MLLGETPGTQLKQQADGVEAYDAALLGLTFPSKRTEQGGALFPIPPRLFFLVSPVLGIRERFVLPAPLYVRWRCRGPGAVHGEQSKEGG